MALDLQRHPEAQPVDGAHTDAVHVSRHTVVDPSDGAPDLMPMFWNDELEQLLDTAPGPGTALWVDALDPGRLSDHDLVDAVKIATRVEAWAHAHVTRLVAALARRPDMRPLWNRLAGPEPKQRSIAGETLAAALATSPFAANALVREATAYDVVLPGTADALAAGRIDAAKARAFVQRLSDQAPQIANAVESEVLPYAETHTVTEIRRKLDKTLIRTDPQDAVLRHRDACRNRLVSHPRALPDGMASMYLLLPAVDAVRVDGVLERAARSAKSCGDARTLDQLRADGVRDLVVGSDDPWPVSWSGDRDGESAEPGDSAGSGDNGTTGANRTGSDDPTSRASLTGSIASATSSGASTASGSSVDHRSSGRGDGRGGGGGGKHQSRKRAGSQSRAGMRPGAEVLVTMSLSTLIGADNQPADLAGYGPIDPITARALAAGGVWRRLVHDDLSDTVLDVGRTRYRPPADLAEHVRIRDRRCVFPGCTIPAEHTDLDHTIDYHAGTRSLHVHGIAPPDDADPPHTPDTPPRRDHADGVNQAVDVSPTATPPTATTHATATEATASEATPTDGPLPDGLLPDASGPNARLGTTSAGNLGPLCRRHHRVKTETRFTLRQTTPGVFEWTSPTGHRYLVQPGTDTVEHLSPGTPPPPF